MVHDIVVFSGSSHAALAERICQNLSLETGKIKLGKFSNGETSISVNESVREKDVYVIQSGRGHVNDNFIELLIILSACKTASAKRVTAVLPLFPYSRQPDLPYTKKGAPKITARKEGVNVGKNNFIFDSTPNTPKAENRPEFFSTPSQSKLLNSENPILDNEDKSSSGYKKWVAQSGTLIANLLTEAGADHIITLDLHDPQFQGYFDIPVDNLYSKPIIQHYIQSQIKDYQDAVVVSPDAGGAKRATAIADALQMSFALIHKERRNINQEAGNESPVKKVEGNNILDKKLRFATTMLVGDVKGKECILIDDLVDTSYTITRAAKLLKDQGAKKVTAIITHGIFSGDAIERIGKSLIDKLIVTNSVPQDQHKQDLGDKLEVLDVSRIFGEAIRRIHNGESVSMLFDYVI